jgi:predicted RNase H-like nuclease (RuvC/YqgF family)
MGTMIDLKNRYEVLMKKNERLSFRITELEEENLKLIRKTQEAIGEMTIVKGIGINSPEMKKAQKEIEQLKKDLAQAKEDHQYDNLIHAKEIKEIRRGKRNDKR